MDEPHAAAPDDAGREVGEPGPAGPELETTVEAVQAVLRAAVDVGRQILDAVERTLDDPATAARLSEAMTALTSVAARLRTQSGAAQPGSNGAVEHIEVS